MYPAEFAAAAQALRNLYDGSVDRFWEDFRSGRRRVREPHRSAAPERLRAGRGSPCADGGASCRSGSTRASSSRRSGSGGSPGTRCGSRRSTATRCAPRARSGSTPAGTTSTTSTSARSRSTTRSRRPAPRTSTSSSTRATHRGTNWRLPAQPRVPRRAAGRLSDQTSCAATTSRSAPKSRRRSASGSAWAASTPAPTPATDASPIVTAARQRMFPYPAGARRPRARPG